MGFSANLTVLAWLLSLFHCAMTVPLLLVVILPLPRCSKSVDERIDNILTLVTTQ